MIPCEMAHDQTGALFLPRKSQLVFWKFLRMRNINRGWKGRFFSDPIWTQELGELHNCVVAGLEILNGNRAVAGSQIDSEAETCVGLSSARFRSLSRRFHRIGLKQSVVTNHRFLAKAAPRTYERLEDPQITQITQISTWVCLDALWQLSINSTDGPVQATQRDIRPKN